MSAAIHMISFQKFAFCVQKHYIDIDKNEGQQKE